MVAIKIKSRPQPRVLFGNKILFWILFSMMSFFVFLEYFTAQTIDGPELRFVDRYGLSDDFHLGYNEPQDMDSEDYTENINMTSSQKKLHTALQKRRTIELLSEMQSGDDKRLDMGYVKEMRGMEPVPYDANKLKYILIWNNAYGDMTEGIKNAHEPDTLYKRGCPQPNCVLVAKRSTMPIDKYDAIILHFRSTKKKNLPKIRSENQRWIFKVTEPASYAESNPGMYNNLMNWTMTYRLDSDIPIPYGIIRKKSEEGRKETKLEDIIKPLNKTKMAAWFVSNCHPISGRDQVAKVLKALAQVDVYGKCGPLKCDRAQTGDCYRKMEREYKFYLSFENSLCNDYVTEKLFSVLNYQVIPVVFGSADYSSIAPPHSYISVLDYPTVGKLVKYMRYLASNETAYNEYFAWKKDYRNMPFLREGYICHLCHKLHTDQTKKVYTDLEKWFIKDSHCKRMKNTYSALSSLKSKALVFLQNYFKGDKVI